MGDIIIPTPAEVASGKSTTEFSVTATALFVNAVIGTVALIHPGFKIDAETQAAIVAVAVAAQSLLVAVYSHGRSKVKQATVSANAAVQTTALNASATLPGAHFVTPPVTPSGPPTVAE